jgi:aryl-alcohol dehydrogenase-like predicted oxidoreductase
MTDDSASNSPRPLGSSDLLISPIGLGCWQFSKRRTLAGKFWSMVEDKEIVAIVEVSIKKGIDWFDTAESYGGGVSEKALAAALRTLSIKPGEVAVASKWKPIPRRASSIPKTIGDRLECLSPYPIDLYQVHNPLHFSSIPKVMEAMAGLVETGNVRYVGVSNYSAGQMRRADAALREKGLRLISNQVHYSLLHRRIEANGILETAQELGVTIIAYSPLAQGLLSGKFHDQPGLVKTLPGFRKYMPAFKPKALEKSRPVVDACREIGQRYEKTPVQVALNWLINFHGEVVVAIPGATKVSQAESNASAMNFNMTRDELDYLDRLSASFMS